MPHHAHLDRGTGRTTRMLLSAADRLGDPETPRVAIVAATSWGAREMARVVKSVALILNYQIDGRVEHYDAERATFALVGVPVDTVVFVDHWVHHPESSVSPVNKHRLHEALKFHDERRFKALHAQRMAAHAPQDNRPSSEYELYTGAGASGGFEYDTGRAFPGAGGFLADTGGSSQDRS